MAFTWPTGRCIFCGGVYYLTKLADHESICSARARNLTIGRAVKVAFDAYPAASANGALLVRLVWRIRDGYFTEPPSKRLTEPHLILAKAKRIKRDVTKRKNNAETSSAVLSPPVRRQKNKRPRGARY